MDGRRLLIRVSDNSGFCRFFHPSEDIITSLDRSSFFYIDCLAMIKKFFPEYDDDSVLDFDFCFGDVSDSDIENEKNQKLMIRCETIDGDVYYHDISEDIVFHFDFGGIGINKCFFAKKFYPDYRHIDLDFYFVFVDFEV